MNIIGLKKCPNCKFKDIYGCHNYYTIGAPFTCPKCGELMVYAPYKWASGYVSDEDYNRTLNYFKDNLEKIEFQVIDKERGTIEIKWIGIDHGLV